MKKFGLQLRVPPDQLKKMSSKPLIRPPASIFGGYDDAKEIPRQASKGRALQMIDDQQKKALEEDPLAFDYDGVYDEMKSNVARSRVQDQSKREPKYITSIIENAKKREREHEIIYERKLLKERSKDDHIHEDKEKFVTSAYKKKLAERAKWLEEERLRGLREEKDDVTKKSDLTDFYFSLNKNVAFGAQSTHISKPTKEQATSISGKTEGSSSLSSSEAGIRSKQDREQGDGKTLASGLASSSDPGFLVPLEKNNEAIAAASDVGEEQAPVEAVYEENKADLEKASKIDVERFKRSEDALSVARERFLARKKAREQL